MKWHNFFSHKRIIIVFNFLNQCTHTCKGIIQLQSKHPFFLLQTLCIQVDDRLYIHHGSLSYQYHSRDSVSRHMDTLVAYKDLLAQPDNMIILIIFEIRIFLNVLFLTIRLSVWYIHCLQKVTECSERKGNYWKNCLLRKYFVVW